ncbi:YihY/virulence factor BrkB family protein [Pedobacter sp. SD-b]|uniref:YihY/virulence factor BrkB family protein n=1 Tax=Pedobacter segetis TaxID=2793069 RepID=A0ABS1BK00_9SPHI|nr:YihY/virulence factor BrkB family protein [Pedobacter segetis]MBK0382539.1 YihY/virulence factor BrkB family protein [Pedobacter segetis]
MIKKDLLSKSWKILKAAFKNLEQNDPLRIASSTAFFGTFAIPAILVVILQMFGVFLNRKQFGRNIIQKLTQIIGENSAIEIKHILINLLKIGENWFFTAIMLLFLIFVSTTLFVVIRNSINQLWCIRINKDLGFAFNLKQRLKSLAIISSGGLLLIIAFIIEGIRLFLQKQFSGEITFLNNLINEAIFFVVTAAWLCIAYRFIGNGKPKWKSVTISAAFTGALLTFGKLIMRYFLLNSNINQIYGTSGAILLVMLFIFYSSFIFYYGACLVNAICQESKNPILPSENAHKFKTEKIEE